MTSEEGTRLQKVLAAAGWGSRRKCEILIEQGRVEVNGEPVVGHGRRVLPTDEIRVDGQIVTTNPETVVIALNKPTGVLSAMSSPDTGEQNLSDLVPPQPRLFHVGRLDRDTSGLLLLTNDGELAQRIAHPSHEITKTYNARVTGRCKPGVARRLEAGVELADGSAQADKVTIVGAKSDSSHVVISLHMGRNRIVRRMFAEVGHPVLELTRTQIGPIHLGDLGVGDYRELTRKELARLTTAVAS